MAGKQEELEQSNKQEVGRVVNSLLEYYEDILLPDALIYGMSANDFWDNDPSLLWAYRVSFMKKLEMQEDLDNQKAWLMGLYNYSAVSTAIGNAFSKTGGHDYTKPINVSELREESKMTQEELTMKKQLENERIIRENIEKINKNISLQGKKGDIIDG